MTDFFRPLDEETARVHGKALACLREAAGFSSQTGLAKFLGERRQQVCEWEAGVLPDRRASAWRRRSCRTELTWERLLDVAAKLGYDSEAVAQVVRMVTELQAVRPCKAEAAAVDPLAPSPAERARIAEAAVRAQRSAVETLRGEKRALAFAVAADQVSRLRTCPPSARLAAFRVAPQFRAYPWALCLAACQESIRQAVRDPAAACDTAELAVVAADFAGDLPWKSGLSAIAIGHLGNAWRVVGDLHKADELLFTLAEPLWDSSPPDPGILDPGRIYDLQSSLRRAQRRLSEALERLEKALPLSHKPGRILLKTSRLLQEMGRYPDSLRVLAQAESKLTSPDDRDKYMVLMYRGGNLCHLRRFEEARPLAAMAIDLAEDLGAPLDRLRALWLHARVAAGVGTCDVAERAYEILLREFAAKLLYYDVLLLTLELAVLYLDMGRPAEVLQLTRTLPADFKKRGVHREALAAVRLFFEAARCQGASAERGRVIVEYLYRARYDASVPCPLSF